uniref:Uncharacterized protein n=1 Tax=viral metagenome TaxID=1070528 RepID=A0A6C0KH86_9ZZZZ
MKDFNEWVNICNQIHNGKYEYIKKYKKENRKYFFIINCKTHGLFEKNVYNHTTKKQGCPKCSKINKLTKNIFIERANRIHNNKYDYTFIIYKNIDTKIKIKCIKHGFFLQLPKNHLYNKQGCPKCCKNKKTNTSEFIIKANNIHSNKYEYLKTKYIKANKKIIVTCKIHGEFNITPNNHLNGYGCYRCSNITKSNEDFINNAKKIHGELYDYSNVEYKSTRITVTILCKIHGEFKQKPNDHLSGCGCQKCGMGCFSKKSLEWLNNLMKKNNIFIQCAGNLGEYKIKVDNKKYYKVDGYCKETNTIYEFNGDFWHGNPKYFKQDEFHPIIKKTYKLLYDNTIQKEKDLINMGYNYIKIWESEYISI